MQNWIVIVLAPNVAYISSRVHIHTDSIWCMYVACNSDHLNQAESGLFKVMCSQVHLTSRSTSDWCKTEMRTKTKCLLIDDELDQIEASD